MSCIERKYETDTKKNKLFYISLLNVLASFAVVMLHCNGVFWSSPKPEGRLWYTSNFIETIMYWAVPIFFMITGVTCFDYDRKYSTKEFLVRRCKKTVIPFIFWSIISFAWYVAKNKHIGSLREVISNILNTNYLGIYWFFIPLFGVYLSIPILNKINKTERLKTFCYGILVGLITVSIMPLISNLCGITYNTGLMLPVMGGYLIYVLLGYYFEHVKLTKKQRMVIYILGAVGWLLHFGGTHFVSVGSETVVKTFKGYLNIPAVLQSGAVFVFVKYNAYRFEGFQKVIYKIATTTFGIYLIHYFVIEILVKLFEINIKSIYWRTFGSILIFGISFVVVYIWKKIPIIKKLVP